MRYVRSVSAHAALCAALAFALYPIFWVGARALSGAPLVDSGAVPWPVQPSLEHFVAVLSTQHNGEWLFAEQLLNSVLVSTATAVVAVVIAAPAAYGLSRYEFLGARAATRSLLATQMFPTVAAGIPLYMLLDQVELLDTHTGLVLVYATTAVPFAIFQLRGAFDAIPRELDEAAMVDGATRFQAFVRIVLPVARPAIAVTALFAFMAAWNEFILAATFLSREELYTLPILLNGYAGEHDANFGRFAAGALIVSVPVMALFYVLQRHIVAGLGTGAVKG